MAKRARIIIATVIAGVAFNPNDVIEGEAKQINQLVKEGVADDSKESIAYCIDEEGAEPIMHPAIAERENEKEQMRLDAEAVEKQRLEDEAAEKETNGNQ